MHKRTAILIGNQNFSPDAGLQALHGPANDVAQMARILGDPQRGNFDIVMLVDESSYNIKVTIEEVLNSADPDDLVLIHYAGHGTLNVQGSLCLASSDTKISALQSTSVPSKHLRDMIDASECKTVVLILDCCYSGVAVNVHRGEVVSQFKLLQDTAGLFILAASSQIQTANEIDHPILGMKMGRFTYSIVEAIESGAADDNQDGSISISELVRYLKQNVKTQTPQWYAANASGDPHISFNPLANTIDMFAEMKQKIETGDFEESLNAFAYFTSLRIKHPKISAEIQTILDRYRLRQELLAGKKADYDSSEDARPFSSWKAFSFGLPPGQPAIMRSVFLDGSYGYELKTVHVERIGVQRNFDYVKGLIMFRYRVLCETAGNIQFHLVPMTYAYDEDAYHQLERSTQAASFTKLSTRRLKIPVSYDEKWKTSEIEFDFSDIKEHVIISFGPRINEGVEIRGPGHVQITNVKLYGSQSASSKNRQRYV